MPGLGFVALGKKESINPPRKAHGPGGANPPPPPTSFSSRYLPWAGWFVLLLALFFGISPARASFTRPSFKALPVIATAQPTQTPWDQSFKLEICTGLVCGNDPVNRHDPLGLADYLTNASWWEKCYAYVFPSYDRALRRRWSQPQMTGRPYTVAAAGEGIASADAAYARDVDNAGENYGNPEFMKALDERYRLRRNGAISVQMHVAIDNQTLARPATDLIEAYVMFSPLGLEYIHAKSSASMMGGQSLQLGSPAVAVERGVGPMRAPLRALTIDEKINMRATWKELGGDNRMLRFDGSRPTAFSDPGVGGNGTVNIGGNVFPLVGGTHNRSLMSYRAVLAHELGHVNFAGTRLNSLSVRDWRPEFGASYWGSKAPGLSDAERRSLRIDAIDRAAEANHSLPAEARSKLMELIYGY